MGESNTVVSVYTLYRHLNSVPLIHRYTCMYILQEYDKVAFFQLAFASSYKRKFDIVQDQSLSLIGSLP